MLHLQKRQVNVNNTAGFDCHPLYTGDIAVLDKSVSLFRNCLQEFQKPDPLRCGSDEVYFFLKILFLFNFLFQMLVGRAGYLAGALWLRSEGVNALSDSEMWRLCDLMITCGQVTTLPFLFLLIALQILLRSTARGPGPPAL